MNDHAQNFSFKNFFTTLTAKKIVLIIITVGILIFFNSLFNGFVGDDQAQVVQNPLIHSLSNIPHFFGGSTFYGGDGNQLQGIYYKPFMDLAFTFIYSIFGSHPFFFHLFQVTVHILNTIILHLIFFAFFSRVSEKEIEQEWISLSGSQKIKYQRKYGSFQKISQSLDAKIKLFTLFLCLLFLIHPINQEAVAYISALQDVLFFFFGILSLYIVMYLPQNKKTFILISFLLLCSLFSKETGILFFPTIIIYKFLFDKKNLTWLISFVLITLFIYLFLRFDLAHVYPELTSDNPTLQANFLTRILTAPSIFLFFLGTVFLPKDLSTAHVWLVSSANAYFYFTLCLSVVLLFLLVLWGIYIKYSAPKKFLLFIFFSVIFLLGATFHLQIFYPLDFTAEYRWFYFPFFGLIGLTGIILILVNLKYRKHFYLFILISFIVLIPLSIRTIVRNTNWYDNITLFTHDIQFAPESPQLQNALGNEYMQKHEYTKALPFIQKSIALYKNGLQNWESLGNLYEKTGEITKAKYAFQQEIANAGNYYIPYNNYALFLLLYDSPQNAEIFTKKTVQKFPRDSYLLFLYALIENNAGHTQEAITAIEKSYSLDPNANSSEIRSRLLNHLPFSLVKLQRNEGIRFGICPPLCK